METKLALDIAINGLTLSSIYALMAIGLTLVFGVLRILNFAHGELLMIGGYMVWLVFALNGLPFPLALLASVACVSGVALAINKGLFEKSLDDPFRGFVISIGLVYVLQVVALLIFGARDKSIPTAITGQLGLLHTSISFQRIMTTVVSWSVIAGVWSFLERSKFGQGVRACIQDADAAALQGIRRKKMGAMVMAIAGGLAGLAGGLISQTFPVGPYFGASLIIKAFIVVVVGGMGSVGGTLTASFLFGFLDSTLQTMVDPRMTVLVDAIVLMFILGFKPRGLFGRD